jgi:hypothetical protein
MIWNKIKWMLVGALVVGVSVYIYNNRSILKKLTGSSKSKFEYQKTDPAFAQYISGFTTGYISSGSTIKIKFTSQLLESVPLNIPIQEKLFDFEDNIEGDALWTDAQTIEFRPAQRLPEGKSYEGVFYLSKLLDVKDELKEFKFSFKVINQSVKVEFNDLKTYTNNDPIYYRSSGILYTADFAEPGKIESLLKAEQDGKVLNIKWSHDEKNTTHRFTVDSVSRGRVMSSKLKYTWDAKALNSVIKGEKELVVPAQGVFTLLNAQVINGEEQFVQVAFSNPVDNAQVLEGLINFNDIKDVKFINDNNFIRIYPNEVKSGSHKLNISEHVRDLNGKRLDKAYENVVEFEEYKPAVKFLGSGVILPTSEGMSLPFEAVNLKAIDVRIVKIYENNILQYLQTNDLDGGDELARVGKQIVQKTINLGITNPADFKHRKKFSLDLTSLIKTEPGAIYRVTLNFKKAYSTYSCGGVSNTDNLEVQSLKEPIENNSGYYYYDDYEYVEGEDYDWEQKDNPCNSAYYSSYKTSVSRNLLSSDLGLTVKKGNDGNLFVATESLLSAQPMSGVEIELYDYQQQLIQSAKTDGNGLLFVTPVQKIYFVVAKKDQHRAYIKLEDGASLSLSMFDAGGESIQKGLKGFIYGERGVWRPGDTLFMSFILGDKMKTLPANHPVIFELQNPQGLMYKRILKSKGLDGFYTFPVVTDKNAPTGNWTATCKVGAVEFTKNVRIETIMPNRLKINVNVGDNKLVSVNQLDNITLHANWLTGITARNLAATVAVSLSTTKTEFPRYKNYVFDDPTLHYESESITLFDGKLNENGDAAFPCKIDTKGNAGGMLKASFATRVYETGGAFSVDRFSMLYSPYTNYVGIQLPEGEKNSGIIYTGRDQEIKVATVNFKGNPVSCNKLRVQVYKLSWRWWWDQYEDELANYTSSEYNKPVLTEDITTDNGKGSFTLNIKEEDWGRYLIRVSDLEGGHSSAVTTYFDWSNWMERGGTDNKIIASLLHFSTDKESYKCGEEVTVNIPSPQGGRALVTIETGSKILEAHWLETEKGNTQFKFKVSPEMAPNIYIHASLMQPHAQCINDLPIRLYGIVPVRIDDPETHLRPVLTMANVLAPETTTDITVSEENGKDMTYTIAMVDEGLLDLTRFKTPDPWNYFYAREALGVKTWDIYDYVLGAYGGELERILSIGGDGSEINNDGAKANRFKPMVRFMGPFHIGKGEKKTHSIRMPTYIGSVRTMLIAGYNGAYGFAEKTTPVKSPLMILGTLPRVLSVGEEVQLPVSVFGGEGNLDNVNVSVETNSLVQLTGKNAQVTSVKKNDEKVLFFNLKVKNQTGIAKVTIVASSGAKKTSYVMELDVRNPNPYRTEVKDLFLDAGKELTQNYSGIGIPGTNSGSLELSTIPPVNLEERLNYLVTYPHGCIEQTTSAAFVQLYLEDITTISGTRKNEIESNVKAAISNLQKFQLANGGFSYWPGDNSVSDWGSIYAGHFLLCAERKGYSIPSGMKQNWIKFQLAAANDWEAGKIRYTYADFVQAYRLYALALAGKAPLSSMNRLRESNLSVQGKWRLAAAYAITGNTEEAEKIINNVPGVVPEYKVDYYTYGSSDRDDAMILETMCLLDKKSSSFNLLKKLSASLSGKKYMSTQSTAYGLLAVSLFIKKYGSSSAMQAEVVINNKPVVLKGNNAVNVISIDFSSGTNGIFKVVNKGKGILYARLINRGKPEVGQEKEEQENLMTDVVYRSEAGDIIDPTNLKQGTDFFMEVTIKNAGTAGPLQNIALINYVPSGWEIHNARMDDNEALFKNSAYDYQDIRDDRIFTYFDLRANESKKFVFSLNASYSGSYYLPGVNAEAMYDNSAYSRKKGVWIKVVK